MSRWRRYDYYGYRDYYPPSRPREAKGGIKAQTKRGSFGQSWWAKRWIAVLESFDIGARLSRGRSYARRGQVTAIEVTEGLVKAKVQGSRPKPYDIVIKVATLSQGEWRKLADALGKEALFAAKLLAGEMPEDIEKAFAAAGLSLFPAKSKDLDTDCSCPDWSNPCKHIAAVYYLLGEEFDRDPFLVFKLRGMTREKLVALVGGASPGKATPGKIASDETAAPPAAAEPLPAEAGAFWGSGSPVGLALGEVRVPPVAAALPKRLGNFPFWRGKESFLEALERIYTTSSTIGMDTVLGERRAGAPRSEPTNAP
jgi:uncharacterized Zn finger protein